MIESTLPIGVPLLLLGGAIVTVGAGLVRRSAAWPITLVVLVLSALVSVRQLLVVLAEGPLTHRLGGWPPPIGIEFAVDGLSAFVTSVVVVIALLVLLYARDAVRRETPEEEVPFFALLQVLLLGLTGMVLTGDLFNLYVFFEISSLAGYALVGLGSREAPVSAFRYLLLGSLGASFYLMGVGYLYVLTGSLNMADVASILPGLIGNPTLTIAMTMMVAGLSLKMALFPLHGWLPDAYTYASSTATAVIAPIMTKVSAYVLIRVLFFVCDPALRATIPVGSTVAWLAATGIVVGSVMAIAQSDVKRMLAYSSVAQVAYIGVGIGLGTPFALIGATLHILSHATMKSCLFLVTGSVQLQTGRRSLHSYEGLGRVMPWTFAGFTLAALAMIGIPPTAGFFSKWYLVLGGINAGEWPIVLIVVASSLLTAGYFFRLMEKIYANPSPSLKANDPGMLARISIMALGAGVLVLGVANFWFVGEVLQPALPATLRLTGM
ncbi:MAG: NADH/ubiquinone/plastoquinone (complex I) [Gemmatimonadetes bacterium]|nr:NADH/ubiquinone/plastoquinone (complex I) [Gemmatimonadota bacterium]